MTKKTIKYVDYNGEEREEDFYFNLSKAELMEMELTTPGGMKQMLEKAMKEKDTPKLYEIFKEMIAKSYGQKSPDGRQFIKNPELTNAFLQTEAYSELFMELAMNADAAAEFMNGVIPVISDVAVVPAE